MIAASNLTRIQTVLNEAVDLARANSEGQLASYIPELAAVPRELTSVAIMLCDGTRLVAGDFNRHRFTMQSVAKLILLAGFLEEAGEKEVFSWINAEPSGLPFSSATQLDIFGPTPANPLVNAGAILLCNRLPGNQHEQMAWLERWGERLLGSKVTANQRVFKSEWETGDRNRALAYLMKSNRVISGLYDESGIHLVRTGFPAKSGVSGLIVAVATSCGGIAVCSPRVNNKGGSVRGHIILEHISRQLGWHFAFQQQRKEFCQPS